MIAFAYGDGADAPCPFCGNAEPKMLTMRDDAVPGEAAKPYVRCSFCGARGPCSYQTRAQAASGWNKRVTAIARMAQDGAA